jgi:hypothetical protein
MTTLADSRPAATVSRRTALAYFAAGCTAEGRRALAATPLAVKSYAEIDGITEAEEREMLLAVAAGIDAVTAEGLSRAAAWYEAGLDQFCGPFPGETTGAAA